MSEQSIPFHKNAVAARAAALFADYEEAIAGITPEAGFGGIWESEMFLFYAAVSPYRPGQILESGRARGKSTLALARCFPKARIVSVEFDRESANAAAAEAKLKAYENVELLYGDSRTILPGRLRDGDAVIIDGPKEFRGVELALRLLRAGKPCAVFIHDFPPNAPWRKFVERHWPDAFFGDDPLFEPFRVLDQGRDPRKDAPHLASGRYGVFACLPSQLPAPYWRLHASLLIARCVGISL
ncbi:MAG: putative methyltransferase [Verrucomicrobiota bacterium]